MDPQVYVFGYRNRYRSEEGEVARGKTSPATDGDQGVAGQASMYEERAAVPNRATPACLLCGQAWADILEAHDQPLYSGKGVASPDTAEPRLQVGPSVVGNIPPFMEWSRHYAGGVARRL